VIEDWNPEEPILNTGFYRVRTAGLDHRTLSMAYSVEEKNSLSIDLHGIRERGFLPESWINGLKKSFLSDRLQNDWIDVPTLQGEKVRIRADELARELIVPKQRHKISYATDGAASSQNRSTLLNLIENSDYFYSETCFMKEDEALAHKTKHFTTQFIAEVAKEANVKKLAPFHFSKRYLGQSGTVLQEISSHFQREVIELESAPPQLRL
jgi:ribonuclease Z